ncbi:hypothetical protein GE09DRAFT_620161 [Coniochaeta sp. 2T2.1]|nr:hypothetical protein GE09DRAFT_620161 [Coniochaeta sp. 2T2.1]
MLSPFIMGFREHNLSCCYILPSRLSRSHLLVESLSSNFCFIEVGVVLNRQSFLPTGGRRLMGVPACCTSYGYVHVLTDHADVRAVSLQLRNPLRCIGAGACGSVWADPLSPSPLVTQAGPPKGETHHLAQVIKREAGSESRSVANEYEMHRRLLDAVNRKREKGLRDHFGSTIQFRVNFPDAYALLEPSHPAWCERGVLGRLPEGSQPCRALVNERVPSMPLSVRNLLIDRYCPARLQDEIRHSEKNKDCIIRLYLGRRRLARRVESHGGRPPPLLRAFSLRNLPLHVD